jgi:adenosylhomocysteinase
MKNGAIICNTGHYDCEINIEQLKKISKNSKQIRNNCVQYEINKEKKLYLLAEGRLINLAGAEGHPSEVMDMSFANQFLALCDINSKKNITSNEVYTLPREIDIKIAKMKLESLNVSIDELTDTQTQYQKNYMSGT